MTDTFFEPRGSRPPPIGINVVLVATLAFLATLPAVPLRVPIGPMYWDLFIYFDAANRIFDGQAPSRDFFAPVGPLGYWLFAGGLKLFPRAQPLLLVDWSLLVVTAPAMLMIVDEVRKRSVSIAFAILLPFLFFSILPFNVEQFYSYPGVDGFGIYNRQGSRLLYVLVAALVFTKSPWRLAGVIALTMTSLFLTKVTGFIAGGLVCCFALVAGRIPLKVLLASIAAFALGLAVLEISFGVTSAYLRDIAQLVGMNEGSLLPRFAQAASVQFGILAPAALLVAVLAVASAKDIAARTRVLLAQPSGAALASVADRDVFWLAVTAFAGLFFETQNTGGQAFIFIWPVLLRVLLREASGNGSRRYLAVALVAATALPTPVNVAARASRAAVGQLSYEPLASENLKTLGAVTQRADFLRRADTMLATYARFPATYESLAEANELPSATLFAEPDFQIAFLESVSEAVAAVRRYETTRGVRFETIMNLDFVNPFPWLLDRHATRFIAIGADPSRTVPAPDSQVATAVRGTDLALYSKCPITDAKRDLLRIYQPMLADHRRIALSPCWDAFVRADPSR